MTASFFQFDGDKTCVDKQLTPVGAPTTIKPYRPLNDLEGTIVVSDDFQTANYVKMVIAGKEKAFYIRSRTIDTAGRMTCLLYEDVLATHSDWIKSQKALLLRSYAYGNDYLPAGYPTLGYNKVTQNSSFSLDYGKGGTAPKFILVTAGRGYDASSIKDELTTQIPVN